jgi:hypothetical protein
MRISYNDLTSLAEHGSAEKAFSSLLIAMPSRCLLAGRGQKRMLTITIPMTLLNALL